MGMGVSWSTIMKAAPPVTAATASVTAATASLLRFSPGKVPAGVSEPCKLSSYTVWLGEGILARDY